jgi:hypothetical protein
MSPRACTGDEFVSNGNVIADTENLLLKSRPSCVGSFISSLWGGALLMLEYYYCLCYFF